MANILSTLPFSPEMFGFFFSFNISWLFNMIFHSLVSILCRTREHMVPFQLEWPVSIKDLPNFQFYYLGVLVKGSNLVQLAFKHPLLTFKTSFKLTECQHSIHNVHAYKFKKKKNIFMLSSYSWNKQTNRNGPPSTQNKFNSTVNLNFFRNLNPGILKWKPRGWFPQFPDIPH